MKITVLQLFNGKSLKKGEEDGCNFNYGNQRSWDFGLTPSTDL